MLQLLLLLRSEYFCFSLKTVLTLEFHPELFEPKTFYDQPLVVFRPSLVELHQNHSLVELHLELPQ